MNDYRYGITARWSVEPISPAAVGEKFLGALEAISAAVPTIGEWQLAKPPFQTEYLTIDEARTQLVDWVEDNPAMVDDTPDLGRGYTLIAMNIGRFSPKDVGLTATIGGKFGDSIRFRVGSIGAPSDPETASYPLFRAALLAIITQWSCVWADAALYVPDGYNDVSAGFSLAEKLRRDNISLAPGVPPHPVSGYHRPWLGYLCAPLTKGLVPPVGVPCERTAGGGLLMIGAEERLDPTNPDHMRRSRAIAEVMIARAGDPPRPGYWPLDEDWPPAPEGRLPRGPKVL